MADFKTISTYLIKKKLEEEEEKKSTTAQASGTSSSSIGSSSSSSSASSSGSTSSDGTSTRKTTQNRSILDATSERVKEKRDAILNRANGEYDETKVPDYIGNGFAALIQKREQEEKQKREARKLAAEQLMQNVGWKKTGDQAIYATPFSPLPDPDKEYTLPSGKKLKAGGSKAQVPGAYGITPEEYLQAMGAIDKYNQKPELSAESKATLNRWFPEKKGQMPTDEELDARGRNIADQFEGEQYGRAVQALKKDYEAVQKALVAYQEPSKATDGVLSDETRDFLQKNFGEKYQRGELPTADEIEAWAETQTFDRDGLEQLYAASDEIQKVQASHDASHEVYDAYAEAIKLLGADAEQYAGQSKSAYYERFKDGYRTAEKVDSFAPDYSDKYGWFKFGPSEAEMTTQAVMNKGMYTNVSPELLSGAELAMQNMTDEQRETYIYLASVYGEDTAYDYFQALLSEPKGFNEQAWFMRDKALRQKTNERWLGETMKTFLTAPAQVAGGMYSLGQYMKGEEIDPYHNMFVPGQMTQTPRSETSDMITRNYGTTDEKGNPRDTLWSWLLNSAYQAGVSAVDSKIAAGLTFGTSPLAGSLMQGTWGVGSTVQDAKLRGGSDEQALVLGALDMVVETATEYIPMEQLLESMNSKDVKKAVDILRRGAIGALSEAPGEAASAAAGWITDDIVMGAMSNWDALVKEKGQLGAALDVAGEVLTEGFIGGLSGAGGNITAATGAYARNKVLEKHEDQLVKEAAEKRAEQQIAEREDQAMLESLPADMPVQETAVPEYAMADQHATADQDAQRRNQEAKQQEQMNADQEARQRARQQELEQKNAAQDAEMRGKAAENASKAAQSDEMGKAKAEEAKAVNEAKNQDKQRAFQQKQEAMLMKRDGTNERVTVTGVDHVENGTVYVTVADANGVERVESADEMAFSSDVGELLASDNIDRLDERGVAAYIDNYNAELASVKQYERAFVGVYERARAGMNYRQAVTQSALAQKYLTQETASQAFIAGTARFNTDQVQKQQKRQKFQDPVLNAMNKMAGGKIFMVDSLKGNSMYDKATGNIYIAKDAQKGAYSYYAMHELVHKLKHESPAHWETFSEMVVNELLAHEVDIDAEMAHVRDNYKAQGIELEKGNGSYLDDGAFEEVIANNVPALLQDRAVLEKMVAKDRTLMEKIREWFEGFMDKLHNAMVESGEVMSDLESWHNIDLLKGDSAQLMQMYDCLVEALESTKGEQKTEPDVKLSARENDTAQKKYAGKNLANDKSLYDYDFLIALPDMRITEMADINAVRDGGNVSEEAVINLALANGRENGRVDGDLLLVQNAYTGRNIRLTTSAIRHGLGGRKHAAQNANARAFAKAGDLMKNAVPVNALFNTGKAADGTYAMAAYMRDASNKVVQVAVLTVEQRSGDVVGLETYDTLHAMNTRKWNVGDHKTQSKNSSTRSSEISISDFLEIVNETHQSLLSENVLAHFNEDRNPQGYYSGRAKFSLREDSAGNTLTEEQQEYFADSKVRDENGNLMVMYHGTPNGSYDRFRSGTYFTPMKDYADVYQSPNASSISVKRNADNPQTYQVYLNMEKPFDTRNAKERRIFMNEYYRKYGTGAPLSESGLPDWTDGLDLQEFIEEMGYDYDGLILDEGGVPDGNGGVKSRGLSYVIFDPAQAKTVDNKAPTDDERFKFSLREPVEETRDLLAVHNLTEENMRGALELGGLAMPSIAVIKAEQGHSMYGPISAIFDKSTIDPKASSANEIYGGDAWTPTFPQVEYEVAEEVEKRIRDKYYEISEKYGNSVARPLYAFANTLEETVNRNGGVEPIIEKLKRDTSVMQAYLADSGQQMVEPVVKKTVIRMEQKQVDEAETLINLLGADAIRSYRPADSRSWMEKYGDKLAEAYEDALANVHGFDAKDIQLIMEDPYWTDAKKALRNAYRYLRDGAEKVKEETDYEATDEAIRSAVDTKAYEEWLNDLFVGTVKGKGIRNDKSLFTPSGKRRSFAATHWEVTLDNVVRSMHSEEKTGVGSLGGRNIEGAAVKKYNSIKDMKADSGRLQTIDQDEYEAMRKGFKDRFSAIARDYAGDGDWFDAGDVLVEAVTKHQTADGIYKYISKYADLYKPSKQVADDLHALVEEMKNAPTGYFEAKPRRAIGFDEMAAVIVPDNLSDDVRTALEDAGANMIEYEAGNEADRLAKMNGEAVSNLKFSLRESDTTVQDELTTLQDLFHLTSAHRMTDKEAVRMARKVKTAAQSTMETEELAGKLKHIYDYVERGGRNASMEEVDSELNALAEEIMVTSRTLDYEHEERMQPIRDYLRKTPIRLTDEQQKEASGLVGNIGTYRRMLFGRVRISQKGTSLDTLWGELSAMDESLFPADAGESEMAALLLEAVDAIAPVYLNDSGLNAMEAAQWLTGEMNKAYLSLSGVQAAAKESNQLAISLKQYRKLTERFANEHKAAFDEAMVKVKADMDEEKRKQLEEAEKQYRLDVLNARADAKAEYKDEIARVKADADAKIAKMKDKLGEAKATYRDKQKQKNKEWRKEYRTAQSEKYKEFRDAYREAMQKKDKEWREQYREDRKETERKQRYRGQITRMVNELVKLLERPTDKKHVLDGLQEAVLTFCHNIDLGGRNKETRSLQSRITSLVKALEDAQKGTESGDNQYLIDPDLLDSMKVLAEEVKALGSMNDLTADQMRDMRDMVRGVAHIVKSADQMFAAEKGAKISDAAMNTMEELSRKKDKKQREGFLGKVDELMNNGMLDSFRAFDRFGTTARKMYQGLRDGFDTKVRCISQANDYVQEHLNGTDKDIVKGKKAKKTTYEVSGGKIELTKAQVMELYCLSKRESARKHLYNGGITTDAHVSMVRITEADVQNITSTLTNGERKLADALQAFLEKECSKWGNETSMTLYGYRKYGEKGYYPMRVDDGSIDTKVTEKGQAENLWALVHPGFSKELSDKANQPLRIGDIFDTFSRHVDSMSSYRAYAAPIADMLRWYNWKPYGEQGIKTMLTQKFGVNGREYVPNLIRDLNGQSKAGYTPGIAEGFTKNAKAAAVGANVRVVIQQPTAIARAAVMMNPKYIAQGEAMTPKRMKECGNLAKQYCPIAKWKSMGYYETHMGKGLRDLMFGGQGVLDKASDVGMKAAGWADEMTWAALWNACEKETRDLHPELKGEALYEATGKRLGEIIDYTQVVDTPFHRSQLMRSKNSMVQMATAFMSEPTKTYNMLQASIARWAENRRDPVARAQVGRTLLVFVATGVLNAAAQSVIDAMRDDDDEEKLLEKYWQAFGGNVLENVNPFALLPYASDIISIMQGYEPSRMDVQMVQKIVELGNELKKTVFDGEESKWSTHKWIRKWLSVASYATGVPLENFYRDVTSFISTVVMQFGGKPLPTQHETATEKMAFGNMYDALMDGNQKKWSRIEGKIKAWEKPKSNSDIDNGIGKLLAEDDERIAKAWEAKSAGKASEVSRIRKEMVNELAKTGVLGTERLNEIVDKAINTYGNKVTPKDEKPVDTEKALKVKMYTTKDAANAVRGIANGTTSLADAKAIMSELVADSEAKDPQKSVRSDVLSEVKKDYLEAAKSGDKGKANKLGNAMKDVLGTTQKDMDKWVTDSYADDLRTAVDANNTANAKNIMAKLRARGLDDYDIKNRLSKYREAYIEAVKSGNRTKANKIKSTLMGLGLKYEGGDPMYTESTFEGWLK